MSVEMVATLAARLHNLESCAIDAVERWRGGEDAGAVLVRLEHAVGHHKRVRAGVPAPAQTIAAVRRWLSTNRLSIERKIAHQLDAILAQEWTHGEAEIVELKRQIAEMADELTRQRARADIATSGAADRLVSALVCKTCPHRLAND